MTRSQLASALGKLAKGKPKNYSPKELLRRKKRMIAMNKARKKK